MVQDNKKSLSIVNYPFSIKNAIFASHVIEIEIFIMYLFLM
jgi:hypothetical protein